MRWLNVLMSLLVAGEVATAGQGDAARGELKKLEGTWKPLSVMANGQPDPDNFRVTYAGGRYTVTHTAGSAVIDRGAIRIDPARTPKSMDVVSKEGKFKGKTLRGIYELSGD